MMFTLFLCCELFFKTTMVYDWQGNKLIKMMLGRLLFFENNKAGQKSLTSVVMFVITEEYILSKSQVSTLDPKFEKADSQ